MNWDKVRKESLVRNQGALRVPPEQAWTRSKSKKRKRRTGSTQVSTSRRPLKECPNCGAMVRETRLERHMSEACSRRRTLVSRPPHATAPRQNAPVRARIVGPAEQYVTCRGCAVEVLASRLPQHERAHKAMPAIVSEHKASRPGIRAVGCSRCGELVRVDLLKTHVAWHAPVSRSGA